MSRVAGAVLAARARFEALLAITPARLIVFLTICVWAAWGIFDLPRNSGVTQDWLFFQSLEEISRRTVLEYHQFPFWNPFWCGGITHIGNPQTTFLAPTFPLVLMFGSALGERLSILAVLVVACEGTWRLLRHLGMGGAATLWGALAWPLFGRTVGWYTDGQVGLHGMTLAPWVLYGWLAGLERPRYLVLAAAFLAWIVAFRGIQPGPQLALALGLWALLLGRQRLLQRRPWGEAAWPAGALVIVGVLGAGFVGVRMLPVLQTVLAHPRVVVDHSLNTLTAAWVEIYFMAPGTPGYGASGYAFIGHATYLFFLGALLFAAPRRRGAIPLVVAAVVLFVTLGDHGEYSPYFQLHRLPLYRSLRNPTLYSFTGALFLVLGACYAIDELDRALVGSRRTVVRAAAAVLVAGAIANGIYLGSFLHGFLRRETFGVPPAPWTSEPFRQTRGNRFVLPVWPKLNLGTLSCYDETPWPSSPDLRIDLPAEEYLADPAAGVASRAAWSPNRIEVAVELSRPTTLVVNQNFAAGWHSSIGHAHDRNGLLAVDLPAGNHRVVLSMLPPLALAGLAWTMLSLGAAWLLYRRDGLRADRRTARPPA